jgi:hypothetical protein
MKPAIFAILLSLGAAGCGSTQQAGQAMRTSWIGQPADTFFVRHGAAAREQTLSDGRRVYVWQSVGSSPTGATQLVCSADVVTDRSGRITDIRPREDTIGLWNTSRCSEIFGS